MDDERAVGVAVTGGSDVHSPAEAPTTIPDYSTLPSAGPPPTPIGIAAVVAVKIVGLYCLVQALPFIYVIPSHLILLFSGDGYGVTDVIVNLLHPSLYLVAGVLLVRRATWVATRVLGFENPSDDPRPAAPGRRLQAIAFSVVGLWLVLAGLVELVRLFVQARYDAGDDDVIQSALYEPSSLAAAGAQLALGAWLFFGSKRLASFWHRFRMRPARPDLPAT